MRREILEAWRAKARELNETSPGSPDHVRIEVQVATLRSLYRDLFSARPDRGAAVVVPASRIPGNSREEAMTRLPPNPNPIGLAPGPMSLNVASTDDGSAGTSVGLSLVRSVVTLALALLTILVLLPAAIAAQVMASL